MKERLLTELTILLYVFLAVHIAALFFYWYWQFPLLDTLMHLAGGFLCAGIAYWAFTFSPAERFVITSETTKIILSFFIAFCVGVLWETFEFKTGILILFPERDVLDTISDLFLDMIGALIALFYLGKKTRHA